MRKGFCLLAACALLGGVAAAARAAKPPGRSSGVDFFGQPARSVEVAGRPLANTLALFAFPTYAAQLPAPTGLMQPLDVVARHLRGDPGALIVRETRRLTTAGGTIYLVPTVRGWLCVQGPTFQTCHRGLLREGVTWNFYSSPTGLDVIGIAANDVRTIALVWGNQRRQAKLGHNVFFVHRPLAVASVSRLPPLGRLAISYRSTRAATTVPLR